MSEPMPKAINIKAICAVIDADATGRYVMLSEGGRLCVLGKALKDFVRSLV